MLVVSPSDVAALAGWLSRQTEIALDTETTGLDPYAANAVNGRLTGARICGVSMTGHDGQSWYVPVRHKLGANLDRRTFDLLIAGLSQRVNEGSLNLLMWSAKFDVHMLAADGLVIPRSHVEDFMLAAHLLNENEPSFGLKEYADKYRILEGSLDEQALHGVIERYTGRSFGDKSWKGHIWELPAAEVCRYAETDTELTLACACTMRPALDTWRLVDLFTDVNRYMLMVARAEQRGVKIDQVRAQELIDEVAPLRMSSFNRLNIEVFAKTGSVMTPIDRPEYHERRSEKTGRALKVRGRPPFNPKSPAQIQAITGWPTTDVRYVEGIDVSSPWKVFADALIDFRTVTKITGTYYDAWLSLLDRDGFLHANYNLHGTVTGRASCSKPNLQNVPRYKPPYRRVKEVVIPADPSRVLIEVDYQAAELRLACHYARQYGDVSHMAGVFARQGDPHGEVAHALRITRHAGKTLNFLIIYGGGIRAITKLLGCDEATARAYLDGYHRLNPGFRAMSTALSREAEHNGYIRYDTGRIRRFNSFRRSKYEMEPRKAMNSKIQGTSVEMLRVASQRLDERIRAESLDADILLQIHDSLLIEVDRGASFDRLIGILPETMLDFGFTPAPQIDVKFGDRWAPMDAWRASA